MVIHGAIDGYSRLPVYLKCSANNRADTVLGYFREAVHTYGLPLRVRTEVVRTLMLLSSCGLSQAEDQRQTA